jgi:hypothetical protein
MSYWTSCGDKHGRSIWDTNIPIRAIFILIGTGPIILFSLTVK